MIYTSHDRTFVVILGQELPEARTRMKIRQLIFSPRYNKVKYFRHVGLFVILDNLVKNIETN